MSDGPIGDPPYISTFDWEDTNPAVAIYKMIAKIRGVDVAELEEDLNEDLIDKVDIPSLNKLVKRSTDVEIRVRFGEYSIRIEGESVMIEYQDPHERPQSTVTESEQSDYA